MKPVLQALVLAERVYTDSRTNQKVICGTFNHIHLAPDEQRMFETSDGRQELMIPGGADPGCCSAYVSLTEVFFGTELTLTLFNQTRHVPILSTGVRINKESRLDTIELIVPLPPLRKFLTEAGTYSLDVVWDGEILGSHRILVSDARNLSEGE